MPQSFQCMTCKHYLAGMTCEAFEDGIPYKIASGEHDHREPYEGDNGIRYESINGVDDGDSDENGAA